ncbi:MAG TPA: helix-turn-helix domain-containing protein [Solirubrobacteraceae bacterium]
MSLEPRATGSPGGAGARPAGCCPFYHEAVELIGRRWTGAIVAVLLDHGPLRFSEIAQAVPELSDRLLSERMKELEARGLVARHVEPGPPVRVSYELTAMGHELQPALDELRSWARQWLAADEERRRRQARPVRTL